MCDCGEGVGHFAARARGAQNVYGQETSVTGSQYFRHWRDKEQSEKDMPSMAIFGPTARVFLGGK